MKGEKQLTSKSLCWFKTENMNKIYEEEKNDNNEQDLQTKT